MTTRIGRLGPWMQTRNALYDSLGACGIGLETAPFSNNAGSDWARLNQLYDELNVAIRKHSVVGLKLIDEAINQSNLIAQIQAASVTAKREADRIKNATRLVNEIAAAVGKVISAATLFGQIQTIIA